MIGSRRDDLQLLAKGLLVDMSKGLLIIQKNAIAIESNDSSRHLVDSRTKETEYLFIVRRCAPTRHSLSMTKFVFLLRKRSDSLSPSSSSSSIVGVKAKAILSMSRCSFLCAGSEWKNDRGESASSIEQEGLQMDFSTRCSADHCRVHRSSR